MRQHRGTSDETVAVLLIVVVLGFGILWVYMAHHAETPTNCPGQLIQNETASGAAQCAGTSTPAQEAASSCSPIGKVAVNETILGALQCVSVVNALNALTGAVTLAATNPVTLTATGNTLTVACPSCVTTTLTVNVYSSLNKTVSGSTVTLGIDLTHTNYWSVPQHFDGSPTGIISNSILPEASNSFVVGNSNNPWNSMATGGAGFNYFHAVADANPTARLTDGALQLGAGAGSPLDLSLSRSTSYFGVVNNLFQPLATNYPSYTAFAPSGSGDGAQIALSKSSDLSTNYSFLRVGYDILGTGSWDIVSQKGGSNTLAPIVFTEYPTESFRINTDATTTFSTQATFSIIDMNGGQINHILALNGAGTGGFTEIILHDADQSIDFYTKTGVSSQAQRLSIAYGAGLGLAGITTNEPIIFTGSFPFLANNPIVFQTASGTFTGTKLEQISVVSNGVWGWFSRDSLGSTSIERLQIGGNTVQGSAGITSFEPLAFSNIAMAITSSLTQIGANGNGVMIFNVPSGQSFVFQNAGGQLFKIDASSGGIVTSSAAIVPNTDATWNLGSTSAQWNILYSYEMRDVMNNALNIRSQGGTSSTINFYSGSSPALRLSISGTSAQGSAGITSYEPILFAAGSGTYGNPGGVGFDGTSTIFLNAATGKTIGLLVNTVNIVNIGGSAIQIANVPIEPFTDAQGQLGTPGQRISQSAINQMNVFANANDANPTAQLTSGTLKFGDGGATALSYSLQYGGSVFGNVPQLIPLTSNTASTLIIAPSGSSTVSNLAMFGTSNTGSNYQFMRQGWNYDVANYFTFSESQSGSGASPLGFRWLVLGTNVFKLTTTGIGNTQGFQSVIAQSLTNPSTSTNISLPVAEPDTSYSVVCTGNFAGVISVSGKTTTQFTVNYPAIAIDADTVDCIITHQ